MIGTDGAATGVQADLAHRVRRRLEQLHPGAIVGELADLPGGHSGLTYAVSVDRERHVVKAVPPGQRPIGRNDVLRQAEVLRALEPSVVPVPRVVAVDEHEPAWFAMTYEDGEAVEPILDDAPLEPLLARQRMLRLSTVLRELHDLDISGLAVAAPEPLEPGAELQRWSRTMQAVPEELRPGSAELLRRLGARVPSPVAPVLVHGDLRLGNVLFVGTQPRAVVDWEIWSAGDPRTDLGWFLVFTDHTTFPGVGHAVPGLPSEHELLAAYAGDGDVPPDMTWFRALGRMKMAAIMGHNLRRHREGKHHDPVQEQLPPTIAALIASARSILD
jgi:aminoglycoside phosphotransferase (APT) family kinase protein